VNDGTVDPNAPELVTVMASTFTQTLGLSVLVQLYQCPLHSNLFIRVGVPSLSTWHSVTLENECTFPGCALNALPDSHPITGRIDLWSRVPATELPSPTPDDSPGSRNTPQK
jgi:hypothetical protein